MVCTIGFAPTGCSCQTIQSAGGCSTGRLYPASHEGPSSWPIRHRRDSHSPPGSRTGSFGHSGPRNGHGRRGYNHRRDTPLALKTRPGRRGLLVLPGYAGSRRLGAGPLRRRVRAARRGRLHVRGPGRGVAGGLLKQTDYSLRTIVKRPSNSSGRGSQKCKSGLTLTFTHATPRRRRVAPQIMTHSNVVRVVRWYVAPPHSKVEHH